ncbi:glutamine amidotransferase [Xenophilus arseniciresistens]|uniref:Glutamine amidotransferase n=1 Tax=Xenophilus arseniciresistens TaxID=1283306 RepID=A0AAE3SXD3_9BURK|nr:glutamine amidotransferase [Xenophilus arseniciresistens]MDA7414814.1 glutamine amidotransferase [Xenophilus arseniciresistens]
MILAVGNTDAETARTLGDFSDWIAAGLQGQGLPVQVLDPRRGDALPEPQQLAGVVITGSHAMVTERAPWSEAVAAWLRKAVPQGLPTLGICYGHQLLADALGGQADDHPGGLELGTVEVQSLPAARSDPLFAHLPPRFKAQVVHRQRALRLPEGAVPLAANAWEAHQAFRIGDWAWGVQFHPEFSAPAMQAYVDRLGAEAAMPASVAPTPEAASLLPRFAQLAHLRATA